MVSTRRERNVLYRSSIVDRKIANFYGIIIIVEMIEMTEIQLEEILDFRKVIVIFQSMEYNIIR